ncbi:Hsp33 family molecular chaperone HslO [Tatumella sp. TA1]|uniref:Hsp33 family molecular chaperone HslO n=1 Tax=Rosenbergiella collisarenosi TaxID=1544695 RepID=UPI0008F82732|nr:Hsp33 family molecular chaperone HslO [Rosenbergiella collisarenosi]MBT0722189.1 Hsp33 family molecular chaperone HslO [Rosenbergiella collisarenosi]QGX90203.1 Hsp33 family molecular chaperone HslO [Tatumella sp. TA1]
MSVQDQLHRYLFADAAVRGELVNVSHTLQAIVEGHDYPIAVRNLMAEMLVTTSLMTATLKFEGDITVQLQGDGPLAMAVINGNDKQELRGVARVRADIAEEATLAEMLGEGYLVITITPAKGERYQGIVALEKPTFAECIEEYFLRSEQLPTRLIIRNNLQGAAGILLQVLPSEDKDNEALTHLSTLATTVTEEELITLPATDVLWRLFHQEEVTVYDPQPVQFKCSCSRQRCGEVLKTVSVEEIDTILAEDGKIDMHCDYCGSHYLYDAVDVANIRNDVPLSNSSIH